MSTKKNQGRRSISDLRKELRYMSAENIAKDFPSKRERAAIAAVFEWYSLNSVVARPLKRFGHYATGMKRRDDLRGHTANIVQDEDVERARRFLKTAVR
jgi:hypothetical protein